MLEDGHHAFHDDLGEAVPDSEFQEDGRIRRGRCADQPCGMGSCVWCALEEFRAPITRTASSPKMLRRNLLLSISNSGRTVVKAAQEFERIAVAASSTDDVRREALWKAADLYEGSKHG